MWYEPTDINKATKPLQCPDWSSIAYASPNLAELKKMVQVVNPGVNIDGIHLNLHPDDIKEPITQSCVRLLDTLTCVLVTLGKLGVMVGFGFVYCRLN